jgi:2-iminobutanoate/2-iminopropanoate deaminase
LKKKVVHTKNAPAPVAPYSQAIIANGFVFISGQVGNDPSTGKLVDNAAAPQAAQALRNIAAILEEAGSGMDKIVKCTVFLKNIDDFSTVNGAYKKFFPHDPPARAAFAVANLPLGALVEIEAIALA